MPKLKAIRNGFHWHAYHWSDYYGTWVEIPGTAASQPDLALANGRRWHGEQS